MHNHPNGRIPSSALKPIPGNGQLWNPAADAYRAMAAAIQIKLGVSMALYESTMRRTYRPYDAQVYARNYWCSQGACGNAAYPGTSNHGLGIAVDLASYTQRSAVDRYGSIFGWSKAWSDAAHEWWHLKWREGVWSAPNWPRTLKKDDKGKTVGRLQGLLRNGRTDKKIFKKVPAKGMPGRGHFGRSTRRAVIEFQKNHGLKADGVVGPATWRALGVRPK